MPRVSVSKITSSKGKYQYKYDRPRNTLEKGTSGKYEKVVVSVPESQRTSDYQEKPLQTTTDVAIAKNKALREAPQFKSSAESVTYFREHGIDPASPEAAQVLKQQQTQIEEQKQQLLSQQIQQATQKSSGEPEYKVAVKYWTPGGAEYVKYYQQKQPETMKPLPPGVKLLGAASKELVTATEVAKEKEEFYRTNKDLPLYKTKNITQPEAPGLLERADKFVSGYYKEAKAEENIFDVSPIPLVTSLKNVGKPALEAVKTLDEATGGNYVKPVVDFGSATKQTIEERPVTSALTFGLALGTVVAVGAVGAILPESVSPLYETTFKALGAGIAAETLYTSGKNIAAASEGEKATQAGIEFGKLAPAAAGVYVGDLLTPYAVTKAQATKEYTTLRYRYYKTTGEIKLGKLPLEIIGFEKAPYILVAKDGQYEFSYPERITPKGTKITPNKLIYLDEKGNYVIMQIKPKPTTTQSNLKKFFPSGKKGQILVNPKTITTPDVTEKYTPEYRTISRIESPSQVITYKTLFAIDYSNSQQISQEPNSLELIRTEKINSNQVIFQRPQSPNILTKSKKEPVEIEEQRKRSSLFVEPIIEPIQESINEPIFEPVVEPIVEPVEEPITPIENIFIDSTIPKRPELSSSLKPPKYNIFVRRKGFFSPVGEKPSLSEAFKFGENIVEKTAAASFKIEAPGKQLVTAPTFLNRSKFRPSKRESGVFVELNKFRINTPGEKREITFKGIFGIFGKRKKRGLFA